MRDRDRPIRRRRRPRRRPGPQPRARRHRLPPLERGRPQPALARCAARPRRSRAAATSRFAAAVRGRDGRRVVAHQRRRSRALFRRVRPAEYEDIEFHHGLHRPITSSFPSGHATAAFCAARCSAAGPAGTPSRPRSRPPGCTCACTTRPTWSPGAAFGLVLGSAAPPVRALSRRLAIHGDAGNDGGAAPVGSKTAAPSGGPVTRQFAVSFDYRCPFARNGHEAVVAGTARGPRLGRPLPAVLARPGPRRRGRDRRCGNATPTCGAPACSRCCGASPCVTRSPTSSSTGTSPRSRPATTRAPRSPRTRCSREIATSVGLDADAVAAEVASGRPLKVLAEEHTEADKRWNVFGVPTFIVGERAAFVRFMDRGNADRRRPGARPPRVDRPQRVQAHQRSPLDPDAGRRPACGIAGVPGLAWPRAHVGHRSDHVGGREGPRAPLRLLQPDDPRARARRRSDAAHDGRAVAAIPRLGQRVVGAPLRIVPPAFADDPTLDISAHVRRVALPGRRGSRSGAARPLRRAGRTAVRPRAPLWEFTLIEGLARRTRRAAPEGAPHDHRRRRRPAALARVRRLRTRRADAEPRRRVDRTPSPMRRPHDTPLRATRTPSPTRRRATLGMARRVARRRRTRAHAPAAAPGPRRRHRPPRRARCSARSSTPSPPAPT